MGFFDPREHADKVDLEIAGETIPWLISKQALETAEEEGIALEDLEVDEEADIGEATQAVANLLYVGTIPFREVGEDVPTLEDFDVVVSPGLAQRIGPKIMAKFQGIVDEELEDVVGKE
jgi:hypothetical protein